MMMGMVMAGTVVVTVAHRAIVGPLSGARGLIGSETLVERQLDQGGALSLAPEAYVSTCE